MTINMLPCESEHTYKDDGTPVYHGPHLHLGTTFISVDDARDLALQLLDFVDKHQSPFDNEEICDAKIPFGDDHGDNSSTFVCQIMKSITHIVHCERGDIGDDGDNRLNFTYSMPYYLIWKGDRDERDKLWQAADIEHIKKCQHKLVDDPWHTPRKPTVLTKLCTKCGCREMDGKQYYYSMKTHELELIE